MTSERRAPVVAIHRVRSADEAAMFERLGADIIGVALAPEHGGSLFDDDRAVTAHTAAAIGRALSRARLAVTVPDDPAMAGPAIAELARGCGASYVRAPAFDLPDADARRAIADAGLGLIVSRVDAGHDDDPGWLLGPVRELADPNVAFVEVELLAEMDDAWRFLCDESPQFPDELQIADIDGVAAEAPVLLSVNAGADTAGDITRRIPAARGLSLTLGALSPGRADVHVADVDRAVAVVRAVRGLVPGAYVPGAGT